MVGRSQKHLYFSTGTNNFVAKSRSSFYISQSEQMIWQERLLTKKHTFASGWLITSIGFD
jgi:hypothetical protein